MSQVRWGRRTVQDRPLVQVRRKLSLGIGEERQIQLLLLGAEVVSADQHGARRQVEIISPLHLENGQHLEAIDFVGIDANLGATKHHPVQEDLQLLEGRRSGPNHAILLNRSEDLVVPEASLSNETSRHC